MSRWNVVLSTLFLTCSACDASSPPPVVDAVVVERAVALGTAAPGPLSVYGEVDEILGAYAVVMESGNPWVVDEELLVLVIEGDALALDEGEPIVASGEMVRIPRSEIEDRFGVHLVEAAAHRMDGELMLAAKSLRSLHSDE